MKNKNPIFATPDFRLACTLQARGHRVIPKGIKKDNWGTVWYTFRREEVEKDVQAWKQENDPAL